MSIQKFAASLIDMYQLFHAIYIESFNALAKEEKNTSPLSEAYFEDVDTLSVDIIENYCKAVIKYLTTHYPTTNILQLHEADLKNVLNVLIKNIYTIEDPEIKTRSATSICRMLINFDILFPQSKCDKMRAFFCESSRTLAHEVLGEASFSYITAHIRYIVRINNKSEQVKLINQMSGFSLGEFPTPIEKAFQTLFLAIKYLTLGNQVEGITRLYQTTDNLQQLKKPFVSIYYDQHIVYENTWVLFTNLLILLSSPQTNQKLINAIKECKNELEKWRDIFTRKDTNNTTQDVEEKSTVKNDLIPERIALTDLISRINTKDFIDENIRNLYQYINEQFYKHHKQGMEDTFLPNYMICDLALVDGKLSEHHKTQFNVIQYILARAYALYYSLNVYNYKATREHLRNAYDYIKQTDLLVETQKTRFLYADANYKYIITRPKQNLYHEIKKTLKLYFHILENPITSNCYERITCYLAIADLAFKVDKNYLSICNAALTTGHEMFLQTLWVPNIESTFFADSALKNLTMTLTSITTGLEEIVLPSNAQNLSTDTHHPDLLTEKWPLDLKKYLDTVSKIKSDSKDFNAVIHTTTLTIEKWTLVLIKHLYDLSKTKSISDSSLLICNVSIIYFNLALAKYYSLPDSPIHSYQQALNLIFTCANFLEKADITTTKKELYLNQLISYTHVTRDLIPNSIKTILISLSKRFDTILKFVPSKKVDEEVKQINAITTALLPLTMKVAQSDEVKSLLLSISLALKAKITTNVNDESLSKTKSVEEKKYPPKRTKANNATPIVVSEIKKPSPKPTPQPIVESPIKKLESLLKERHFDLEKYESLLSEWEIQSVAFKDCPLNADITRQIVTKLANQAHLLETISKDKERIINISTKLNTLLNKIESDDITRLGLLVRCRGYLALEGINQEDYFAIRNKYKQNYKGFNALIDQFIEKTKIIQSKNPKIKPKHKPLEISKELVQTETTKLLKIKLNAEIKRIGEIAERKEQEKKRAEAEKIEQARLAEEKKIEAARLLEAKRIEQLRLENERKAKFIAQVENNSASLLQAVNVNKNTNIKQYFFSMNNKLEERILRSFEFTTFLTSKIGNINTVIKGSVAALLFKSFFDYDLPGSYHPRNLNIPDIDLNLYHEKSCILKDYLQKLQTALENNEIVDGLPPWIRKILVKTKNENKGIYTCEINDGEFDITIPIGVEKITPAPINLQARARLLPHSKASGKNILSLGNIGAIELQVTPELEHAFKTHEFTIPEHDVKNESYFKIIENGKRHLELAYSENINLEHFNHVIKPENINTIFANIILTHFNEYKKHNNSATFVPTRCHSEALALIKWHKQKATDPSSLLPYLCGYFHNLSEFYQYSRVELVTEPKKPQKEKKVIRKKQKSIEEEKKIQEALKKKEEKDAKQLAFLREQMSKSFKEFSKNSIHLANQFIASLDKLSFNNSEELSLHINKMLKSSIVPSVVPNSIFNNESKIVPSKIPQQQSTNGLKLGLNLNST